MFLLRVAQFDPEAVGIVESAVDDRALLDIAPASIERGSSHRGDQRLDEVVVSGIPGHG
ncbi:hypothetical protein ACFWB0_23540 [Rhodococcus sp. NPDC060086]|uniref:hypothetical protein n=1 Tax=Rhodococcus sp. NPDC060086 TaxID=3347055 RepID=UPI003651D881